MGVSNRIDVYINDCIEVVIGAEERINKQVVFHSFGGCTRLQAIAILCQQFNECGSYLYMMRALKNC